MSDDPLLDFSHETLEGFISEIDRGYGELLKSEGLEDNPLFEVCYYTAIVQVIAQTSEPDRKKREEIMAYLQDTRKNSVADLIDWFQTEEGRRIYDINKTTLNIIRRVLKRVS